MSNDSQAGESTVFVVDDDQAACESVATLVRTMGFRAELFSSAEEFLASYAPDRPGCLVTDLRMLGMSGVELQERLNRMGVELPTIVISAYADVPVTVQAMQQGALTLLEKPCRDLELWDAIREALRMDAEARDRRQQVADVRRRLETLTDSERDVMEMVVEGVPNKVIANRLELSVRTIETRRRQVFQKMGVQSVAQLVRCSVLARQQLAEPRA